MRKIKYRQQYVLPVTSDLNGVMKEDWVQMRWHGMPAFIELIIGESIYLIPGY